MSELLQALLWSSIILLIVILFVFRDTRYKGGLTILFWLFLLVITTALLWTLNRMSAWNTPLEFVLLVVLAFVVGFSMKWYKRR